MKKYVCIAVVILLLLITCIHQNDETTTIHYPTDNYYMVQHYGETEEDVYSNTFLFDEGKYRFELAYSVTEEGNYIQILNHGSEIVHYDLERNNKSLDFELILEKPSNELQLVVHYTGAGYIELTELNITPVDRPWYYEKWVGIFGVCCLLFLWIGIEIQKKREKLEPQKLLEFILVLGLGIVGSSIIFSGYAITTGDDLRYHLSRIEGIASGLSSGQFPVYIYPDYLKGNGYLNVMYPSIFLYIPACFRLLGVSLELSYKILLLFINIATVFAMYYSMKSMKCNKSISFLASVVYLTFRYRLVDMYERAAIGETLALIFLPIVIAGIYHIVAGEKEKWKILLWGMTGVIQSHVLSACMDVVVLLLIVIFYVPEMWKQRRLINLAKAILGCIIVNLFFVVPFLDFYIRGNLDLEQLNSFEFWKLCISPSALLGITDGFAEQSGVSQYSLHLAIVCLLGIAVIYMGKIMILSKKNEELDGNEKACQQFIFTLFVPIVFCLIMATTIFPYERYANSERIGKIFYTLQFPWRFVGPAGCLIIICGSMALMRVKKEKNFQKITIAAIMVISICDMAGWKQNLDKSIYPYENRNEEVSSTLMSKVSFDAVYLPGEYLVKGDKEFKNTYELSNEFIDVENYDKNDLEINLDYSTTENGAYIDLPLQNYLWYQVKDETGHQYDLVTNEHGCQRIALNADGKIHHITCLWKKPIGYLVAEIISLVGMIVLSFGNILKKFLLKFINKKTLVSG